MIYLFLIKFNLQFLYSFFRLWNDLTMERLSFSTTYKLTKFAQEKITIGRMSSILNSIRELFHPRDTRFLVS